MRVAVVGSCASGKSTIAEELRRLGHDAYVVGQEHTEIRRLWLRQAPDALVYLHVSLDVIRHRRGPEWPEWLYQRQQARLADARAHADIVIDTGACSVPETVKQVIGALDRHNPADTR